MLIRISALLLLLRRAAVSDCKVPVWERQSSNGRGGDLQERSTLVRVLGPPQLGFSKDPAVGITLHWRPLADTLFVWLAILTPHPRAACGLSFFLIHLRRVFFTSPIPNRHGVLRK